MSKIIRLTAANVKRLRAVEIKPDGSVVIIGGRNGAGKSSCLDSIAYALGGKREVPAEPIRRGEKSAEIVVETDDLVVKRRFTAKGTHLEVTDRDGIVLKSPQTILDRLVGSLSFDPLAFSRMAPGEQLETLKSLVGLDFAELDQRRQTAYDNRRAVNRELKAAEARLAEMPRHEDAPEAEVSVAELARELERRQMVNSENAELRRDLKMRREEARGIKEEIEQLEARLARLKTELEAKVEEGRRLAAEVNDLQDEDVNEIRGKITSAEEENRKFRENEAHRSLQIEINRLANESQKLSDTILAVASEKAKAVADANMPIGGLGLGEDGVTLNNLPLEQASSSEQLRASVAIGLAMHSDLRVLLIRDGSLLDEDSMKMIATMAKRADSQIWLEVVNPDDPTAVIIEDGMIQDAKQ